MSIKDIAGKIKGLILTLEKREVYTLLIIILVGFGSFGLGRLSVIEEDRVPIRIEGGESGEVGSVSSAPVSSIKQSASAGYSLSSGSVVASKNGTKYYLPWCGGANRISTANKVTFPNKEAAEKAGYAPASNCKGI